MKRLTFDLKLHALAQIEAFLYTLSDPRSLWKHRLEMSNWSEWIINSTFKLWL